MNIIKAKTFTGEATFGLKRGYKEELISIEEFKMQLIAAQQRVYKEMDLKLSAKVSLCSIVFSGQDEPSVDLSFIQYPKFPIKESSLKKGILRLVELLMKELDQNRVVVVFDDETIMKEVNGDLLDPAINFSN